MHSYLGEYNINDFGRLLIGGEQYQLYPHTYAKYVVIVPNRLNKKSEIMDLIYKSPLLNVWTITIILITILRKLFQYTTRKKKRTFTELLINTFGMSFGTTSDSKIKNRPEQILLLFLSIFSLLAGIFCSGELFQQYSTYSYSSAINSLEDLSNTDIIVLIPTGYISNETIDWLKKQYVNTN